MDKYHRIAIKSNTLRLLNRCKALIQEKSLDETITQDKAAFEALNYYINQKFYNGVKKNGKRIIQNARNARST